LTQGRPAPDQPTTAARRPFLDCVISRVDTPLLLVARASRSQDSDHDIAPAWLVLAYRVSGDMVRLQCTRCGRHGQYRKALLDGPDIALPDLRHEIAQCERQDHFTGGCGVYYEDLKPAG
jgi:hypothetical protein